MWYIRNMKENTQEKNSNFKKDIRTIVRYYRVDGLLKKSRIKDHQRVVLSHQETLLN